MSVFEIIVLILVILGIVGKQIDASLKKAGNAGTGKEDAREPFCVDDCEQDAVPEDEPEPFLPSECPDPELLEGGYRSIKDIIRDRQAKIEKKENAGRTLDIDPKKLVIYSEIMKTKF